MLVWNYDPLTDWQGWSIELLGYWINRTQTPFNRRKTVVNGKSNIMLSESVIRNLCVFLFGTDYFGQEHSSVFVYPKWKHKRNVWDNDITQCWLNAGCHWMHIGHAVWERIHRYMQHYNNMQRSKQAKTSSQAPSYARRLQSETI